MSYPKENLVLKIGFFSLTALLLGIYLVTACDFNIEITDERRYLSQIGGTVRCASKYRIAKGTSGEIILRLFLVDDKDEAIDLEGIDQEPYNFKVGNIWIAKPEDTDGSSKLVEVEVLSPKTGFRVPGVKAQVDIAKGAELNIYPNPRFIALKRIQEGKRVPKAIFLSLDLSKAEYENTLQVARVSALSTWITSHFNEDATIGDLDLIGISLAKNDNFSIDDIITYKPDSEDAYFLGDKYYPFLYTTETVKTDLSNQINAFTIGVGKPPLYDSLQEGVKFLRAVIKPSPNDDYFIYNPAVIAISLNGDTALLSGDKKIVATVPQKVKGLVQLYRGNGWKQEDGEEGADFIPLMSVVYPRPFPDQAVTFTGKKWDTHVDNLCQIATAAKPDGVGSSIYWGQLFIAYPYEKDITGSLSTQLNMAYYAMTGYMELKFSYRLQGAKKGESYVISFRLGGKLLDTKIQIEDNSPRIMFRVDIPK